MVDRELIKRLSRLSSATVHEALGRAGALPSQIKAQDVSTRLFGTVYPVTCPSGDNLWLHWAILTAGRGDVIVADVGGGEEHGYWGEVMGLAAQLKGIAGLVITGGVRDSLRMTERVFPVFSTRTCVRGTEKDPTSAGRLGEPINIGDVGIARGDFLIGDADGVVVVPRARAAEVITLSEQRDEEELLLFERLRGGATTVEIYNLPALDAAR